MVIGSSRIAYVIGNTGSAGGTGLEVTGGVNVILEGSGEFNIIQRGGNVSYGVKASDNSSAEVTNIRVMTENMSAALHGAYADNSLIYVRGDVYVFGTGGCGAKALGNHGRIVVNGTITAYNYINIGLDLHMDKDDGVEDFVDMPGYLKYCGDPPKATVWVKKEPAVPPGAPQNFTATPGNGEVTLSWIAPASDGGSAILRYEVSKDDGASWENVELNTSYTFTGLTNGTEYTFMVRAVNGVGNGDQASASATPSDDVCQIISTGNRYADFAEALGAAASGDTIKLLTNITHTSSVLIEGKTINIDLGDYDLLIDTSSNTDDLIYYIIMVKDGGKLKLTGTGTGKLSLRDSSHSTMYGAYVLGAGSEVTVNNVEVSGSGGIGLYMYGSGMSLDGGEATVNGDIIADDLGVRVNAKDGRVTVNGNITAGHSGVQTATNPDTEVVVKGSVNVLGTTFQDVNAAGVLASGETYVKVEGDVIGRGAKYTGVYAFGGTIEVLGDVVSLSGTGAKAEPNYSYGDGEVTIYGSLSAEDIFVMVGDTEKAPEDITVPSTKEDFLTYTDGVSTVWVKKVGTAPAYYTVTVEIEGNGTASASLPFAQAGREINVTATPEDGYRLKEWQVLEGSVTIADNRFTMPGSNVRLKAIFEPIPTSTYSVNFYDGGLLYASKTVSGGSALGSEWPASPVKSGHSFGGWFTGQNGTGQEYTSSTIINDNVDLYAKWIYNYIVDEYTPTPPAYRANIKTEGGDEKTVAVSVGGGGVNVSIEEDPWHTRPQEKAEIIMPAISGVRSYSLGLSASNLKKGDGQGTLTLNTDVGSITIQSNMLAGVAGTDGEKAQITLGRGDSSNLPEDVRNAIGNRPLIQLTMSIDGRQVSWSNEDAPVRVSIPYTPTEDELRSPEGIVVWYIDGAGNLVMVPGGRYDPETGTVSFATTHFSYYAVGYNLKSFKDVPGDAWYAKPVAFIAAREITLGTGDGNFSPEGLLTRGQFIVMLMRAYGIAPDVNFTDNFSDAGDTYYTGYLAAAKRLGISAGVGNNLFAPEREISRQEAFALLYNAQNAVSRLPEDKSGKTLSDFSDAGLLDTWALEAVSHLVETGVVRGSGGKLNPADNMTRAEMAQLLYNLLAK